MAIYFQVLLLIMFRMDFIFGAPQQDGIKGGVKGHNYQQAVLNITEYLPSLNNLYPNLRNLTGSSHTNHHNETKYNNGTNPKKDYDRGVCFVEVPTITLAKDPNNVPLGNGSTPTMSKIRKCCPGYERNIHNYRLCEPVCEQSCINANCIAPNVCSCHPGHVVNLDGYCTATCPIGCLNGQCGVDNQCICNPGYELETNKKFCKPKCSKGCGLRGNCTEPEICSCELGFAIGNSSQCEPFCEGGCHNGDCVAPGQCLCKSGYSMDHKLNKCLPICSKGCPTGECIAPETCSCARGFKMSEDGQSCKAHCEKLCLNGECTGPNQCTCKPGYVLDSNDPTGSTCIGHCPNGCPNGTCSGPNLCICLPGFVKDKGVKGSQLCKRRERRSIEHVLKFLIPENDY